MLNTKKLFKNIMIYFFSAALSILLIWYIIYHLFNGFQTKLETVPAILETKSNSMLLDAYIVRDETVLYATNEGGVNYLYDDGAKVSAGTVVAKIYSGEGAREVADKILSIDKTINILENSSVSGNATKTDTIAIDRKINDIFFIIRDKIEDGDVEFALYRKDELLTYLNKRQVITQNVSGFDEQIIALQAERNELTGQLINLDESITVLKPGYFYSNADGYENTFDYSNIQSMTLKQYYDAVDSDPIDHSNSLAVGKLINSPEWYVMSEISSDQLKKFTEGNTYPLTFPYNSDVVIKMKLERIIKENNSESAVLVFKTNTMPDNFNYLRKQSVQIVEESYTGYKIPSNALRVVDGVKGVYILSGNTVKFKEVEVLIEFSGYFLVKEQPTYLEDENYNKKLGLYDIVIISGKNLYDGKIVSNAG
jgi:hypothetical protein